MEEIVNTNYQAEIVEHKTKEVLSPVYYFDTDERFLRRNTIVKVSPKNMNPWFGCFDDLGIAPNIEKTGIYPIEKSNNLIVIARGRGYMVDSFRPDHWRKIPCAPILALFYLQQIDVYILNDFQDICAWGADGLLWKTDHFMCDDLLLRSVNTECIEGEGTDCAKPATFTLETSTGKLLSFERDENYIIE